MSIQNALPCAIGRLLTMSRRLLISLLWVSAWAHAQPLPLDAAKRADIERLLNATKAIEQARAGLGTVLEQLVLMPQGQRPALTPEQRQIVIEAHQAVFEERLPIFKELLVQLHHKHFSATDIQQLVAFYTSDVGQRFVAVTPALGRESLEAGIQFGRIIAPQVQQRVQDRLRAQGQPL